MALVLVMAVFLRGRLPTLVVVRSGMFFPFWDIVNGTRFNAAAPPTSAAKPKEIVSAADVDKLNPAHKAD